jgi:hypothetical protein
MKNDGASGGPTRSILIPGPFLMGRWWRNRKVGVMEQWSIGVLGFTASSSNPNAFLAHWLEVILRNNSPVPLLPFQDKRIYAF